MNTYNPAYDYISAHLAYAKKHNNFVPKGISIENSYYELLTEQYKIESFSGIPLDIIRERKNKLAFYCYKSDLQWQDTQRLIHQSLLAPIDDEVKQSFITIGFNHQEFDTQKCFQLVKTILSLSIVLDGSFAVMENYRQNGEHPHAHFRIYHSKKTTKGTLVQTIFRASKAKKYITNSNFIDVKPFMDYHIGYMDGEKTADKLPYVALDKEWRLKNSLPDKVFKEIK